MTRTLGVLLAAVVLASCTVGPAQAPTQEPTQEPALEPALLISDEVRATAAPAAAVEAAESVNEFGLDLFRALVGREPVNTVISPASIAIALSMARLGARGATAAQMDAVLHELTADGVEGINSLDQGLAARSGDVRHADGDVRQLVLRIANAPFGQAGYPWRDEFIDGLAAGFGAGLRVVDYGADPDGARGDINRWVNEQTEERIPELLGPGTIDSQTRLTLVNAIYLKAPWYLPFSAERTSDQPFTRLDGSVVDVPMMGDGALHLYAQGDGWRAVELAYAGEELAMLLILPDDLPSFSSHIDGAMLQSIVGSLSQEDVILGLPRFETETTAELNDELITLGMPAAFDAASADFSGMTDEERLAIGLVVHQANISVDEEGTEAAAATAVTMAGSGPPETPIVMTFDRPFLFALRDRASGAVLFLGQVVDPSAD
jgi:serpin B